MIKLFVVLFTVAICFYLFVGCADKIKLKYESKTHEKNNVKITYPEFSQKRISNSKEINEMVEENALSVLNIYGYTTEAATDSKVDIEIEFEITYLSQKFLSIVFSGMGYVENSAHPNHLKYSTNINIEDVSYISCTT